MNRKLICLFLALILTLPLLVSCADGEDDGTETTTAAGETVAIPRYDYMEADVLENVTVADAHYKNVTLVISDDYRVTDEKIRDYIDDVRFEYREPVNGTTLVTDEALALGDDAYIYYKGFVDGKEFEGGSNWDDASPYKLGLGSGSFIPGFEEALVGVVPSETSKDHPVKITVTFPEDYMATDLAGKKAVFHVAVSYSVQYKMGNYDREFLLETLFFEPSREDVTDEELFAEFEENVRAHLVKEGAASLEAAKTDALWTHLVDRITCKNLPESEVEHYYSSYEQEVEYYYNYYASAYGQETFAAMYPDLASFAVVYFGLDECADWKAELTKKAEALVKKHMIAHAIAEREGMETVTDDEVEAELQVWVDYYSGYMTEEDILEYMGEEYFVESAFTTKMDTWLLAQFTFVFADGSPVVSVTE